MPKWKTVISIALLLYCVAVIFSVLVIPKDPGWAEWLAAASAGIAALGLVAYAVPGIKLPYEEYAYLIVGFAGFTTLLLYLLDTIDSSQRRTAIALFLLSGAITGYGAFLAQGQKRGP